MPTVLRAFITVVGLANTFAAGMAVLLALFAAYHHAWPMAAIQVLSVSFFTTFSLLCLHPRAKAYHDRWYEGLWRD